MPMTPAEIQQALADAADSLARDVIARADCICQSVFAEGIRPLDFVLIEGRVAAAIGEYAVARQCFEEVLAGKPSDPMASGALADLARLEAERRELKTSTAAQSGQRFHLIKSWGFGFTADVDHTLGHLLLAEMTGRTPVVYWGQNCLFRDVNVENAWGEFFKPLSPTTINELCDGDPTFFPSKWNVGNLRTENVNKMTGPGSRTAGILFLNQPASVTVGDFFTSVIELLPWVRPPHPMAVQGRISAPAIESAYRYLVDKYLTPRPEILAAVESFAAQNFRCKAVLAVHVRGSDKVTEMADLADGQQQIFQEVKTLLARNPKLSVFLMTDEMAIRGEYLQAFPGRVITTDCVRSTNTRGVHHLPNLNRRQLGIEILTDMYLAARCNGLLGLGFTNVSNLILHLKTWREGSVRLLGPVMHHERHLDLHL